MWVRESFFNVLLFLSINKASFVFNIPSSQKNTEIPNRHFLYEQFLIFKYSSILHALLHSQSHVLGFHIYSSLEELH